MTPRKFLKRHFTKSDRLTGHPLLRWFGARAHDANLWHLGRRSVAGALGLGLFLAFFPIPIHMLLVIPVALIFRVNLPVIIAAVWVTNPFTWAPIFYFAYRLGAFVTGDAAGTGILDAAPTLQGFSQMVGEIWLPLCVGSLICGTVAGLCGYFGVRWLWKLHVIYHLRKKRRARSARHASGRSGPSAPQSADRA